MMTLHVSGVQNGLRSESFRHLLAFGEDLHQLLRWNDFQLRIGAVAGLLVGAPSSKLSHVTKPAALHVFIGHLDD